MAYIVSKTTKTSVRYPQNSLRTRFNYPYIISESKLASKIVNNSNLSTVFAELLSIQSAILMQTNQPINYNVGYSS